MDEKRNAVLTIAVIFLIILFYTVTGFLQSDRFYSESENRVLAAKPVLSRETLLDGTFAGDYEAYVTDQFVGRDKWITLKTQADLLLQRHDVNGVYLGKDGYLMEQHKPEDYSGELMTEKLALLERLVTRWNARVMLVPTADNILTDKLPANAPYYDEAVLLAQVKEMAGPYRYIDVYSALQEHADEEIYYRTDHHWTSLGAYYGYREWVKNAHVFPLLREAEKRETVTEDFLGTLYSKINLPVEPDAIQYYPETEKNRVQITYDFGRTADSFYEKNYLNTKNKYGFFMDDNHAFVQIHTDSRNGRSLFVIKDSYANSVIPMLAMHYENVYVVDPRYLNAKLFEFMERYGKDGRLEVLVIYNCIHFLEDFNYLE